MVQHVDDSVTFQVYNNTERNEAADTAVEETRGKAVYYNDEIVKTYYYSTSCGYSTDVCAWGSDDNSYPMYGSVHVGSGSSASDMTDNAAFEKYISESYSDDYDSEYALYRWNMTVSAKAMSDNINSKLSYASGRSNLYVYDNNGELIKGNISNVGNVQSIEVLERGCGGVAKRIKIKGSTAECVILGENTIRTVLGSSKETVNTQSGEAHYDILPRIYSHKACMQTGAGGITAYNILGAWLRTWYRMSQNAVRKMAETMDYADILKFFYKGVQIKNVNMDE